MKDRASILLIALVLAAGVALVPLAWLQYRWIGQVSQANEERLRVHLHASVGGFCRDFLQQLVRASLEQDGPVKAAYQIQRRPDGEVRIFQGDEVKWPAELSRLRDQIEMGAVRTPLLYAPSLVFLMPRARGGPPLHAGPPPDPMPHSEMAWRVALLDEDSIRNSLLPELSTRWFAGEPEATYLVRVTSRGKMIFETAPFSEADASAPLPAPGSPWLLEVRLRDAPLAAFVQRARWRNLAVGFGILLVLAVSLVAIVIAMQRAYQLSRLQMEFVAGVSHELRTPLSVICSAGDNLAEGKIAAPEQVQRYGAVIRNEGRRLTSMVEHVMSTAGFFSGRIQLHAAGLEVEPLVEKALKACGAPLVERDVDPGLPCVRGDERMLVQALRNLIENAVKHGGDSHPPRIEARAQDGVVSLSVIDRGPGIPRDELKQIFEPFYRGKKAREAQREGSGLGLALVRRIAEAHGGDVRAENLREGGARFTLTVPVW